MHIDMNPSASTMEDANASILVHSDPGNDGSEQQDETQRKRTVKNSKQPALEEEESTIVGLLANSPQVVAGLRMNNAGENSAKEIAIAPKPTATKKRQALLAQPPSRLLRDQNEHSRIDHGSSMESNVTKQAFIRTTNSGSGKSQPVFVAGDHDYSTINLSGSGTVVIGDVYHTPYETKQPYAPTLFGSLQAVDFDAADDAAIKYRRSRASIASVSNLPTMPITYLPHASVSHPEIKKALIRIAVVCQMLDVAFAEYFRVVVSHLQGTGAKLSRVREQICSRQSRGTEYIGSFGDYCERVSGSPQRGSGMMTEKYQARATGDEIPSYLQDALEVPYWNMMADQFIKSSHSNDQLTYDAVLSVINDKRRELKLRLQQVKQKWRENLPQEIEDGIIRRVTVLESILAQTSDKYDSLEEQQIQLLQRSPTSVLTSTGPPTDLAVPETTSAMVAKVSTTEGITDLEKVSLLSLFFLFTAIAMVPFGLGFAGNWDADPTDAVGSTSDPDFKWLIATTLLSIFGNIYAIVPLRKITRGSTANIISQVFLYLSIALGIWSICVYPFWNKAWSSSLSFFCSFFAIGSVFVSAQHTSDMATGEPADSSKVKKE